MKSTYIAIAASLMLLASRRPAQAAALLTPAPVVADAEEETAEWTKQVSDLFDTTTNDQAVDDQTIGQPDTMKKKAKKKAKKKSKRS